MSRDGKASPFAAALTPTDRLEKWTFAARSDGTHSIQFVIESAGDFDADVHHAGEFHGPRAQGR
jgi:hypothetical protein